jgi:hypothetical protein
MKRPAVLPGRVPDAYVDERRPDPELRYSRLRAMKRLLQMAESHPRRWWEWAWAWMRKGFPCG